MGTLARFGKILLLVKGLEHGRVHFHLSGPDLDCVLDLETLEVLAGHAPAKILRQARAWAKENRQAIKAAWEEQNG